MKLASVPLVENQPTAHHPEKHREALRTSNGRKRLISLGPYASFCYGTAILDLVTRMR
jgi:hypothetical protein